MTRPAEKLSTSQSGVLMATGTCDGHLTIFSNVCHIWLVRILVLNQRGLSLKPWPSRVHTIEEIVG